MGVLNNIVDGLVYYLSNLGLIGGFLMVMLESFFPVLPLGLFVGLNILTFGDFVGYLMSYVATVMGAFSVFLLFRKVVKKHFDKWFKKKKKEKIENLMNKVTHMDFNVLVMIMAIPFMPTALLNVASGLSNVKIKKYLLVLIIGKIPIIFFWGYVGKGLLESIKNPKVLIIIVIMVAVAYILSKIAEKVFKIKE